MARKPTISEIKRATQRKSPHFFDKDSLRFFGQTMGSFKVAQSPKGNIYIYAKGYDTDRGVRWFMGYTFRQFKDGDLKHVSGFGPKTMTDIQAFVARH